MVGDRVSSSAEDVLDLSEHELTRVLTYVGFVLLAHELVRSLIVEPIRAFYGNSTFAVGPFKSHESDVMSRDKNEFEACLMYLRDFMHALNSEDVLAIQGLRAYRNELAHDLPDKLSEGLDIEGNARLLESVNKALFKLSNYRVYMEIGSDPAFRNRGIDWDTVYGTEYMIFKEVLQKVRILRSQQAGPRLFDAPIR